MRVRNLALRTTAYGAALLAAGLFLAVASTAKAATIYDEAIHGDLADSTGAGSVPTPSGAFGPGDNDVLGTMGDDGSNNDDDDLFTFHVPAGLEITSIMLGYDVVSGDPGNGSYFAIQAGTSIGTTLPEVGDNLSNALVGGSGDLLAIWEAGPTYGGTGLAGPLAAGDYSVFASETSGQIDYEIRFGAVAVPEPGVALLLGSGLLVTRARRQR